MPFTAQVIGLKKNSVSKKKLTAMMTVFKQSIAPAEQLPMKCDLSSGFIDLTGCRSLSSKCT